MTRYERYVWDLFRARLYMGCNIRKLERVSVIMHVHQSQTGNERRAGWLGKDA